MNDNKYLDHIEKNASLTMAAGLHLAQSMIGNAVMKNKRFHDWLGTNAAAGMMGKNIGGTDKVTKITAALKDSVAGLVAPEARVMTREAIHMGEKARTALLKEGIDPNNMSKRQMVAVRSAVRGDFSRMKRMNLHNTPEGKAMLNAAGVNPKTFDKVSDGQLLKLEQSYKANPLAGKVGNTLFPKAGETGADIARVKSAPTGNTRLSDVGTQVSNVGLAMADPLTAGVNATKTLAANPTFQRTSIGSKLNKAVSDVMVKQPAEAAALKGSQGIAVDKVKNTLYSNTVSPVAGNVAKSSQEAALALRKEAPEASATLRHDLTVRKAARDKARQEKIDAAKKTTKKIADSTTEATKKVIGKAKEKLSK